MLDAIHPHRNMYVSVPFRSVLGSGISIKLRPVIHNTQHGMNILQGNLFSGMAPNLEFGGLDSLFSGDLQEFDLRAIQ